VFVAAWMRSVSEWLRVTIASSAGGA